MSAILTWIAHGSVLVGLAMLVMRTGRGPNAATRYCLWWAVMAAVLALPVAHAISSPVPSGIAASPPTVASMPAERPAPAPASRPTPLLVVPPQVASAAPWIVALLVGVVLWRLLALARAAARLRRVRTRCTPLPDDVEAQLPLWRQARGRAQGLQLQVTLDLPTPAVLGAPPGDCGRPIIALPLWTIEALDSESLDFIVLHELAHVERGDDRDLLVQTAIEAVFGWHPAVWWVGRQLDEERERACDDEVVRRTDRAAQYARCLIGVAAHAGPGPTLLAAPSMGRAGRRLASRIERLLASSASWDTPRARSRRVAWVGSSVTGLACAVVLSAAGAPRVHVLELNPEGPNWDSMRTSAMSSLAMSARPGPLTVDLRADTPPGEESALTLPAPRAPRSIERPARPVVAQTTSRAEMPAVASTSAEEPPRVDQPMLELAAPIETPSLGAGVLLARAHMAPASLPAPSAPAPQAFGPPPAGASKGPSGAGVVIGRGAAQAGESIGKGATQAGVKTAGFFSRVGRAVASSF